MKKLLLALLVLPVTASFAQTSSGKVGYVDIAYVYSQLPEMKELDKVIVETRQRLENDYAAKRQQLQQLYNELSAKFESLSDTAKAAAQQQFSALQAEVEQFPQQASNTLENTRKLYMAPIYLSMGGAMTEVAEENGYAMLIPFNINDQNFILYADKSANASDLVVKKLIDKAKENAQQHPSEQQPGAQKPLEQKQPAPAPPTEKSSGKKSGKKKQ